MGLMEEDAALIVGFSFFFPFPFFIIVFSRMLLLVIPGKGRGVCFHPRWMGFGCFAFDRLLCENTMGRVWKGNGFRVYD